MTLKHNLLCGAAVGAALLAAQPGFAQSAAQLTAQNEQLQQQMRALQQQMPQLQSQVDATQAQQKQMRAQALAAAPTSSPSNAAVATVAGGHPGICTADGQNCIALTGRLHFDIGDYLQVHPQSKTGPHSLTSGVNARRARIGVLFRPRDSR